MTITYPDVSNHNGSMPLQSGTVACIAKASEGTGYADPYYSHFKSEAARVGAVFGGYHFLKQGNAAAQARFCYSIVGPGVPLMIDWEPEYDSAGNLVSAPTVSDAVTFRDTYRSLGGLVVLNYLPKWYWSGHLGSPSLSSVSDLVLVSSDYTAYSDTGPGWNGYGGLTPGVWQFTDRQPYSGQSVDFNAFKGTIAQFKALLDGGISAMEWTDVIQGIGGRTNGNQVNYILTDIGRLRDFLFGDTTVTVPAGSPIAKLRDFLSGAGTEQTELAGLVQSVKTLSAPTIDYTALVAAMAADTAFTQAVADAVVTRMGSELK